MLGSRPCGQSPAPTGENSPPFSVTTQHSWQMSTLIGKRRRSCSVVTLRSPRSCASDSNSITPATTGQRAASASRQSASACAKQTGRAGFPYPRIGSLPTKFTEWVVSRPYPSGTGGVRRQIEVSVLAYPAVRPCARRSSRKSSGRAPSARAWPAPRIRPSLRVPPGPCRHIPAVRPSGPPRAGLVGQVVLSRCF